MAARAPVGAVIGRPVCVTNNRPAGDPARWVTPVHGGLFRRGAVAGGVVRSARSVVGICLRQIAFVPNAGRPVAAPTGVQRRDVRGVEDAAPYGGTESAPDLSS